MTRLTPHNPSQTATAGNDKPAVPTPDGHMADPATAWTPRTRRVAVVVGLLLLVHVLAVLVLLFVARSAAAETEAKLATLPWAFPKVALAASHGAGGRPPSSRPPIPTTSAAAPAHTTTTAAWQPPPSRDVPAPWHTDSQGHITWTH